MNKEKKILFALDFLSLNISTFFLFYLKFKSGIFNTVVEHGYSELFVNMGVMYLFWCLIFIFRDMYRSFYFRSIIEIFFTSVKTLFVGFVFIYLVTLDFSEVMPKGRLALLFYLVFLVTAVGGSRMLFFFFQKKLLAKGIGLRNTLIVGSNDSGRDLVIKYQKGGLLGLKIVGFIDDKDNVSQNEGQLPIVGSLENIGDVIKEKKIKEVLISLDQEDDFLINKILLKCKNFNVHFKLIPSLSDIISGHVRINELFGCPLMEIFPERLTLFQTMIKRISDILAALILLVVSLPVMLISVVIIKFESPGGVVFKQERTGKDFKEFTLYKFRSMCANAEAKTGAVWATKNDSRITKFGKFIRKTRIDELPQLINVLRGDMSFVGPRPERKVFIDQFIKDIPFYHKRLLVKPGLTGWAQVKHKYDESFDDVKEKLRFDLFYIENMSFQLDIIIMLNTVRVVVLGQGQ